MNKHWVAALLVAVVGIGCKRDKPARAGAGSATGDEMAQVPVSGGAAPATAGEAAPAPGDPREDAARGVVDRWLRAQNQGDFEAYAALYAADFRGVRRSGKKTVELDHAGWLGDRRRMFAKPMQVDVADLELEADAEGLWARFVQTWQSGSYRDRGGKRLRLEPREGELRIVVEEMLESVAALTREGCLAVMYPDDAPAAAAIQTVTVLEPNPSRPRAVCFVHTLEDTMGEYVVALVALRGGRWVEVDREAVTYIEYRTDDGEGGSTEVVRLDVVAIAPTEQALRYEHEKSEDGPQHRDARTETRIYRVVGETLDRVLSFNSTVNTGEADRREEVDLEVLSGQTGGYFDLELTTRRSQAEWAAGGEEEHEDPEVERYTWTGSTYEPA